MLKIQTANGTKIGASIHAGEGVDIAVDNNVVTIGLTDTAISTDVLNPIYSINGNFAASDGSFYIHGSECDSWNVYNEVVDGQRRTGISLVDLCPACSTCDELYKIKKELEYLDIIINMMKDTELHDTNQLIANKTMLESMMIADQQSCDYDHQNIVAMAGMQLLQQYVTIVHMWNYAVTQNNNSFKLDIAPEGASGFTVQTKRALPSCDGSYDIQCIIDVDYYGIIPDMGPNDTEPVLTRRNPANPGANGDQLLSVYVPKPYQVIRGNNGGGTYLDFTPFVVDQKIEVGGSTVYASAAEVALQEVSGSSLTKADAAVTHVSVYQKRVATPRINARIAGTYELSAKFLPFMPYVMYNSDHEVISIRGGSYTIIDGGTSGGMISTEYYPTEIDTDQILAPTEKQYLDANAIPSSSVPFKNVWQVVITWKIWEHGAAVNAEPKFNYVETKYYTCTGCRVLQEAALVTNSSLPVEIHGGTTTPTQANS